MLLRNFLSVLLKDSLNSDGQQFHQYQQRTTISHQNYFTTKTYHDIWVLENHVLTWGGARVAQ
jgi:hypothetical protein